MVKSDDLEVQFSKWNALAIRGLRYRMGWSQAELARNLNLELNHLVVLESGIEKPSQVLCRKLEEFFHCAEDNSRWLQAAPVAELHMESKSLTQVHKFDLLEKSTDADKKTNS